jgi:plastocyanin
MLPAEKTVPVGTRLTFRMTPGSYEDHTATFGPGNPESEPSSYLGVLAAGFNAPVFDQRAVYPSESPAGAGATLTPTLHGNGFWNTGVMDRSIRTPLPESDAVTFGAPGTYTYYCLIHTFMRGTITVQ